MGLSRLSLPGARFFGTTNPDSPYHWLKTDYLDRRHELNMRVFHFNLEDNVNLDPAYVTELKKEYTGLWYKRFILGLWVLAEGVVYDMWNDDTHAIRPLVSGPNGDPKRFQRHIVAVDYGTHNPTVFGLFGYDGTGPPAYMIKEYYYDSEKKGRQKTDSEYADDFKTFLGGIRPVAIYVDPSAASFIAELRKRGYTVMEARNDVIDGIRFVSQLISNGLFYVYRAECPNTLKEFASYIWDEKSIKAGVDKPVKQFDHCMDMIRYGLFTHFFREHAQKLFGFNFD
jgi:PBSX family phage terminase large subunit